MNRIIYALPETYAICRLEPDADIPEWAMSGGFFSVTRTDDELSIICNEEVIPNDTDATVEPGWRALKLVGPIPFDVTGVIASLTKPLAEAGISVSVIATYDTDYLFVKNDRLPDAIEALKSAGFKVGIAARLAKSN